MTEVLFVCTGNTCRSAMAEGLFNVMAAQRSLPARAVSCGLAAFPGSPAARNAAAVAAAYGADLSSHHARRAQASLLKQATHIYCMTRGHIAKLQSEFPEHGSKAALLDPNEIPDPWGGDEEDYRRAADAIFLAVKRLLDEMDGE